MDICRKGWVIKLKNKKTKAKKKKSGIGKKIILTLLVIILVLAGVFGYQIYKNGGGLKGVLATLMGHNENTVNTLDKFYCLVNCIYLIPWCCCA